MDSSITGPGTGKTKLDKEHMKLCKREIVSICAGVITSLQSLTLKNLW